MTTKESKDHGLTKQDREFIQVVCDKQKITFDDFAKRAIIDAAIELDIRG